MIFSWAKFMYNLQGLNDQKESFLQLRNPTINGTFIRKKGCSKVGNPAKKKKRKTKVPIFISYPMPVLKEYNNERCDDQDHIFQVFF